MVDIGLNNSGEVRDVVVSTLTKRYCLDDVLPAADMTLPVFVVSPGGDGALVLET